MKKILFIGGLTLIGLLFGIGFFLFQKPPEPVSYGGNVFMYVNDPFETTRHIDTFLKKHSLSTASSSLEINESARLTFSLPFLYMDALTALLREEATDGVIFGEKTLYGVFEFEPKAPIIVDVELRLIPVSTLQ